MRWLPVLVVLLGFSLGNAVRSMGDLAIGQAAAQHGDCTVSSDSLPYDTEEEQAWLAINSHRVEHELPPLMPAANLIEAANWMAADMATGNHTSHISQDGRNPGQRMAGCGYPSWPYAGQAGWAEAIAWGWDDAVGAFEGWRNSPPHNAIMLHPQMRAGGLARAYDADSNWRWYWVLNVGTLLEEPPVLVPTATPTPTVTVTATRTATALPSMTARVVPTSRPGRFPPTPVPPRP